MTADGLLIATHTHGYVTPAYAQSLARATAFLERHGINHGVALFVDSLVDRGRDRAAVACIDGGWSHLLFIDADIEFEPQAIMRLLAADKDIIVGGYRKKTDRPEFALTFLPDAEDHLEQCPKSGAIKIARAGTGFMLIKRGVFERIRDAMPELHYTDRTALDGPKAMVAWFEHAIRDGQRWSEDYTFCDRWTALGGDIWLDPSIKLGHWGQQVWRGSLSDHITDEEPT